MNLDLTDFDYLEKLVMQCHQEGDEVEIFGVTRNGCNA